ERVAAFPAPHRESLGTDAGVVHPVAGLALITADFHTVGHCTVSRTENLTECRRILSSMARVRARERGGTLARTNKGAGAQGSKDGPAWQRPVAGILLGGVSLVALLALASYRPYGRGLDWAGPLGRLVAGALLEAAGVGAYAAVILLAAFAAALVVGRPRLSLARAGSWLAFSACAMALVDLAVPAPLQGHAPGGMLGSGLASLAEAGLSTWGAAVLLTAAGCAALVVATDL